MIQRYRRLIFLAVVFTIECQLVSAQTVIKGQTDRGWYNETGVHNPINSSYFVGDSRPPGCGSNCVADVRNFFVFDLSSVVQPIASAKLALFVPGNAGFLGYGSGDPSENYELHDVTTSIATLVAGTGGVAAHTDLGSGVIYGSRTMTAADNGLIVEITLNSAALADLDAANGLIAIGGSLTTLDGLPNNEYMFGSTGTITDTTHLRLTLVPEPASLLLCLAGLFATLMRRHQREC